MFKIKDAKVCINKLVHSLQSQPTRNLSEVFDALVEIRDILNEARTVVKVTYANEAPQVEYDASEVYLELKQEQDDFFMEYKGVRVYHTSQNESVISAYWYALSSGLGSDDVMAFDITELPSLIEPSPLAELFPGDHDKQVIAQALDRGLLSEYV